MSNLVSNRNNEYKINELMNNDDDNNQRHDDAS